MRNRVPLFLAVGIPLFILLSILVYNLPPVHDRLAWRVAELRTRILYSINPPQAEVFVPQEQVQMAVQATFAALTPSPLPPTPTATASPSTPTATRPGPTTTPEPSLTPTLAPTPLPPSVRLTGVVHLYQKMNNCSPATLSMALSYWQWPPDLAKFTASSSSRQQLQDVPASYLKPYKEDKNVMPYEMEAFVEENTGLQAVVRVGGNLDLLKRLIAAGFPVIIEKGFEGDSFDGWMGHFELLTGYDDAKESFWVYDSYVGPDYDFYITYAVISEYWQQFNYTYFVIYPPERESEVLGLLGPDADETANYQNAAAIASYEVSALTGRAQYFAWYNYGTNLVKLQDFGGAAQAYDQAFAIYPTIDQHDRPWRMLWYQTGPYFAYYYTGRYYDVINLATSTLDIAPIEESYYWRAMSLLALGDTAGAIEDLQTSLKYHPGFPPSVQQLQALGVPVDG